MKNWGAVYGVGEGRTGNSYAIPTKDEKLKVLSLDRIHSAIHSFLQYADEHPDEYFIFTPVGTGLAGYSVNDIMLGIDADRLPPNVLFTSTWFKEL